MTRLEETDDQQEAQTTVNGEGVVPTGQPVMVKYQDLVHRAYKEYSGAVWLHYDKMFQTRVALDPLLLLDGEHYELWSQCMGPAIPISGRYADIRHLVVQSSAEIRRGSGNK
ncbi:UNVERIFIED_CONTAM: hypothetical protein K2H54_067153 [Gekko kuhli]